MKHLIYILLLFPSVIFGQIVPTVQPVVKPAVRTAIGPGVSLVSSPAAAYDSTNFYVTNGVDDVDADDDTLTSIAEVNALTLEADDTVFFDKGGVWRETLTIPNSGSSGSPIVFTSYGSGAKPQILGSELDSTWQDRGSNVWAVGTYDDPHDLSTGYDAQIQFIETDGSTSWGDTVATMAALAAEYDFFWQNDSIYVYSTSDPGTAYSSVEIPQRDIIINTNAKEYLAIEGFDLRYSVFGITDGTSPFDITGGLNSLTISNTKISYMGSKGAGTGFGTMPVYNDMLFDYDTIFETGRRGLSLNNYSDSTMSRISVLHSDISAGNHTTGTDISTGAGGNDGDIDSVIIAYNTFYESSSKPSGELSTHLIFLQGPHGGAGQLTNVYIYNNIFKYIYSQGILSEDVDTSHFWNNTFYEQAPNSDQDNTFFVRYDGGNVAGDLQNNLFYTTFSSDVNFRGVNVSNGVSEDVSMDYNLYYRTADNLRIASVDGTSYYRTTASFDDLVTAGYEGNSPYPADALLFTDSLNVRTGSPAINAGVDLSAYFTDDYYGVTRSEWNIGAVEAHNSGAILSSFAADGGHRDSIPITTSGYPEGFESITINAATGDYPASSSTGTTLVDAESDSTAVDGTYAFSVNDDDTPVYVTAWVTAYGIESYAANQDTALVDSITVAYSSEYQAVYDAMTTKPGADTAAQQNIMFNRVLDTADLDLFYLLAQSYNSDGEADINWINPGTYDLTEVGGGSLTWTKYQGYNGDGTNYLSTGYNPSSDATYYSLNSGSVGAYLLEDLSESTFQAGADGGGGYIRLTGNYSDNNYLRINQGSSTSVGVANGDGLFIGSRTASNAISIYRNGASLVDETTASGSIPNDVFEIFAVNGGTVSTNEIAVAFLGEGLSVEQVLEINAAVEAYMDYIGTGVQ